MENNQQEQKITIGEAEQAFINKNVFKEEPKEEAKIETVVEEEKQEEVQPQPVVEPEVKKEEPKTDTDEIDGLDVSVDETITKQQRIAENVVLDKSTDKDPNYFGDLTYPATTYNKYLDYFRKLPQTTEEMNDYVSKMAPNMAATLAFNTMSDSRTVVNNVLVDSINDKDSEFVNNIEFAGKKLVTRPISIKTNTKLTQESSIARIYALLGVGEVTQVPLWHSGFWITIKPIKQKDFVNLYTALSAQTAKVGRDTNSLIYSNYSIVLTRILTEFILAHITEHTLKLNDDESLLDYIKVQDLYPMVNGLLCAMYPKGLDIIKSCVNTTKIDPSTNKPSCDYAISAKVDSKKLLWVNRKVLDKYMVSQMSKRTAASVSTAEALEYQTRIKKNIQEIEAESATGVKVRFTLKMPNLRHYIEHGEKWINDLIADTEKLYTEQDTDRDKVSKLSDAILTSRLNTYNAYVDKIVFVSPDNVETSFDTAEGVREALDTISNDQVLFTNVIEKIGTFFTNSSIAIVATPNFICPKCSASQEEHELNKTFNEFIPLNIIDNFFALGGLRKQTLTERGLW